MTKPKAPALCSPDEACDLLDLSEDQYAEAIEDGTLRRVMYAGTYMVLGSDVDKQLRERDPRYLAKLAAGEVADEDNPEDPRTLAADLPRL